MKVNPMAKSEGVRAKPSCEERCFGNGFRTAQKLDSNREESTKFKGPQNGETVKEVQQALENLAKKMSIFR